MRQRVHWRQATSTAGSRRRRGVSGELFLPHRVSGGIAVGLMLMHCVLFVDGFSAVWPPATEMFGSSTTVRTLPTTITVALSFVTETLGGGATTRSMGTCASLVAEQAQSAASSLMASATTNTALAAAATGSLVTVGAVAGARKCFLKRNSANLSTASIEISGDNSDDDVSDAQHVPTAKRQRHGGPDRSRAIPFTYDWRDGTTHSKTFRDDVALDMDAYPSKPTPVNIFTATIGQKVYVPRVQADGFGGDALGVVVEAYQPASRKGKAHIKVRFKEGLSRVVKVKVVEHPDHCIATDREKRLAEINYLKSKSAVSKPAAGASCPRTETKRPREQPATVSKRSRTKTALHKDTDGTITMSIDASNQRWEITVSAGAKAIQERILGWHENSRNCM